MDFVVELKKQKMILLKQSSTIQFRNPTGSTMHLRLLAVYLPVHLVLQSCLKSNFKKSKSGKRRTGKSMSFMLQNWPDARKRIISPPPSIS